MKNHLLLIALLGAVIVFVSSKCSDKPKSTDHKIALIPYDQNVDFFSKKDIKNLRLTSVFCPLQNDSLKYIAYYFGNTLNLKFQNYCQNFIYVPFTSPNQNRELSVETTPSGESVQYTKSSIHLESTGTLGCNYFVSSEEGDNEEEGVEEDNTNENPNSPTARKVTNSCISRLDSFMIGDSVYINLLVIQHQNHNKKHQVEEHGTTSQLENYDFPISLADYKKLDSTLRVSKNVMGGFDENPITQLKIFVDGKEKFKIKKGPGRNNSGHLRIVE